MRKRAEKGPLIRRRTVGREGVERDAETKGVSHCFIDGAPRHLSPDLKGEISSKAFAHGRRERRRPPSNNSASSPPSRAPSDPYNSASEDESSGTIQGATPTVGTTAYSNRTCRRSAPGRHGNQLSSAKHSV